MEQLVEKIHNLIVSAFEQFIVASVQGFHAIIFALLTVPECISSATSLGDLAWDQLSSPGPHAPAGDLTFRLIKIWANHVVEVEIPQVRSLAARFDWKMALSLRALEWRSVNAGAAVSWCGPKNFARVDFYQVGLNSKCAVRCLCLDSELIENRKRVQLSDGDVVVVKERPERVHYGGFEFDAEISLHDLLEASLGAVGGIHELFHKNLGRSALVRPFHEQLQSRSSRLLPPKRRPQG